MALSGDEVYLGLVGVFVLLELFASALRARAVVVDQGDEKFLVMFGDDEVFEARVPLVVDGPKAVDVEQILTMMSAFGSLFFV